MSQTGTLPDDFKTPFQRWKRRFESAVRRSLQDDNAKVRTKLRHWISELDTEQDMRNEWDKLAWDERREQWFDAMILTLRNSPEKSHQVLSATLDYRLPPFAILDSLHAIAAFWRRRPQPLDARDKQGIARDIVQLFLKVKEVFPTLRFEQDTLGLIAGALPRPHFQDLFSLLDMPLSQLHDNTALQFARKLAGRIGEHGLASSRTHSLKILEDLATRSGELVNTDKFRSVVTPLLHQDLSEDPSQRFDTQDAFSRLWDKGFRPNVINLTTYLDTLCISGDVRSAVTAARMFQEYGLPFDQRVFDILFRGAKYKLDASLVEAVLELTKAVKVSRGKILEHAMHSILFFHAAEARQPERDGDYNMKPFLPMLRIYTKRYRLESLQSIVPESLPLLLSERTSSTPFANEWRFEELLVPIVDTFASGLGGKQVEPTSNILVIMIRAYIRSLRQPYELISFWMHFKHQLESPGSDGNPVAQIVRDANSLIHDTFIMEMLKRPGLKRPALEVFGDMLGSKNKPAGDAPGHPAPTAFTFTMLLDRLASSGEQRLSNDLWQLMQQNGVQPDLATMNVQVKRAARQQNVAKTVEALAELEANFQPNEFTFKAFGRLNNQEKALKMIEQVITKRKEELEPDDGMHSGDA